MLVYQRAIAKTTGPNSWPMRIFHVLAGWWLSWHLRSYRLYTATITHMDTYGMFTYACKCIHIRLYIYICIHMHILGIMFDYMYNYDAITFMNIKHVCKCPAGAVSQVRHRWFVSSWRPTALRSSRRVRAWPVRLLAKNGTGGGNLEVWIHPKVLGGSIQKWWFDLEK